MEFYFNNEWIHFNKDLYEVKINGKRKFYYYDGHKLPRRIEIRAKSNKSNLQISRILYNSELLEFIPLTKSEKAKQTNIERYNDENYNNQHKTKKTNLTKYGVECTFQSEDVKEKIKKTNLERYGTENPFQSEDVKEKIKKTNLERYGHEHHLQNKEILNKLKQTNLTKYGREYNFTDKSKVQLTNLERYGHEHHLQNKEILNKQITTNQRKYGVDNISQRKDIKNSVRIKRRQAALDHILNRIDGIVEPLFELDDFNSVGYYNSLFKWKCCKCDNEFEDYLYSGHIPRCSKCYPNNKPVSKPEKEVVDFIKSLGISNIIENSKSIIPPQELDIYLPNHNLAIEYNGLYWHSEQAGIDKNYHINKTLKCEEQGIQLIHIFADDWEFKQEIVKARLKNLLGLNNRKIYARKCLIEEIDAKTKNQFLNKYHIQGEDRSSIKLGAYYEDELIGVMTFSKNRIFGKKTASDEWELSRFATIADTYTPGLASKMLKYFERNNEWNQIYSFADRCWSQGKLYNNIGFFKDKETKPSYWYAYNGSSIREHRYNYRKQNLKKFDNYSPDKTEKQIMDEAGYLRIYDCGTYKFIMLK